MRETFGFQGYFTGDCDAVNEINQRHHWQPDGLGHICLVCAPGTGAAVPA